MATLLQKRAPLYDKAQEAHYNLISALHKSLRGSDVDAALYWFARMLDGGCDPHYLARRITRMAADGATNREIAQALFLSIKTIEMHLGNAYRKLDVASRRELKVSLAALA